MVSVESQDVEQHVLGRDQALGGVNFDLGMWVERGGDRTWVEGGLIGWVDRVG